LPAPLIFHCVTSHVISVQEFPCYTANKVILQCFKKIMGGKQPEAKNMLIRVYNRNVNQIICRKRTTEGNDLIPCTTVWCLVARSKKILVRAEQTKVHCYSYSFQRTLRCISSCCNMKGRWYSVNSSTLTISGRSGRG